MPISVVASTHSDTEWEPRDKDLKRYIHFDRDTTIANIKKIANDPNCVARHSFFPLLRFYEEWTKFRKSNKRKKKSRPLRYASRIDAAIYACYRSKLSKLYEAELKHRGIQSVPVAYRRIPDPSGGNKSNIEIAKDVFAFVRKLENCYVTVVDIKSYFESLDHSRIKSVWELLIGSPLPKDHLAVFRAITNYSIVDLEKLFKRLNLNGVVGGNGNRSQRRMRNIDVLKEGGSRQICSPKEFRSLVAGSNGLNPSLIQKNGFDFGIPQGTPISDLIANFYLIDFDEKVNAWVQDRGGLYCRYSDDIVVVIPNHENLQPDEAKEFLQSSIRKFGKQLRIQDKKICIVRFQKAEEELYFSHIFGAASRNGLEYLGFEYNGKNVKLKNSTLSNAWRKMKRRAYGHASRFVKRYRGKGATWIEDNYPYLSLETKILRDVTFKQDTGFDTWTFIKYIRRASKKFIGFNAIFSVQTKRYRKHTRLIIADALHRAIKAHV